MARLALGEYFSMLVTDALAGILGERTYRPLFFPLFCFGGYALLFGISASAVDPISCDNRPDESRNDSTIQSTEQDLQAPP